MQTETEMGINPLLALGPLGRAPESKYGRLIARARTVPAATTLVVHPCDETSLRGATEAADAGIIRPILVGPVAKVTAAARKHGIDISRFELVDAPHSESATILSGARRA